MGNDLSFVKASIASLCLLDVSLKYMMSDLRAKGAIGEFVKDSFFQKLHTVQLLTAEYTTLTSILVFLLYYISKQDRREQEKRESTLNMRQKLTIACSVLSRLIFALRAWDNSVTASGYSKQGKTGLRHMSKYGVAGGDRILSVSVLLCTVVCS